VLYPGQRARVDQYRNVEIEWVVANSDA
jgi:hypothetical protein